MTEDISSKQHLDTVMEDDTHIEMTTERTPSLTPKRWYKYKEQRVIVMVGILTLAFCIAEIFFGLMVQSLALVSDAFHMISDVISLCVAFISIQLSRGSHTEHKTYGWVRADVLGGLINGVFLIAVCVFICLEAIQRFVETPVIDQPLVIVYVGAGGLVVNFLGMILFAAHRTITTHGHSHGHAHGHAHGHGGKHQAREGKEGSDPENDGHTDEEAHEHKGNANLHAIFLHMLGDALGSVGAIIAGIVIRFSTWEHRFIVDPLLSILFSLIILRGSIPLVKHCIGILMQSVPNNLEMTDLKNSLKRVDGVVSVHDLHVWQLSDTKHIATLHVNVEHEADFSRIATIIQQIFHKHGVHSTTVQPEYVKIDEASGSKPVGCNVACQSLSCRKNMCCEGDVNGAILDQ